MLTDKKITSHILNRTPYYAPSDPDVLCPLLVVDASATPVIEGDDREDFTVRKTRHYLCSESAPFCSYHLGELNPATNHYLCRRYEFMQEKDTLPTDTHNKILKVIDGQLVWR